MANSGQDRFQLGKPSAQLMRMGGPETVVKLDVSSIMIYHSNGGCWCCNEPSDTRLSFKWATCFNFETPSNNIIITTIAITILISYSSKKWLVFIVTTMITVILCPFYISSIEAWLKIKWKFETFIMVVKLCKKKFKEITIFHW